MGPPWLWVVAGLLLLVLGRRLYTALLGLLGFFVGYALLGDLLTLPGESQLFIAVGVGIVSALLAFLVLKVAVSLGGALMGAAAALWAFSSFGLGGELLLWVIIAAAAVLGAWLLRIVFDIALIVVSSFLGALLIVAATGFEGLPAHVGMAVLIVAGVALQLRGRNGAGREETKRGQG